MRDLAVNLVASVVVGVAVWLAQFLPRYRRLARKRAFFGLSRDADSTLVVAKHASSPSDRSVHRRDVAALVEIATLVRECGGRADLVTTDQPQSVGRRTEFCVGGPSTNSRTAAHLRSMLPGVDVDAFLTQHTVRVGAVEYLRVEGQAEYVLLARTYSPATAHPVFLLAGQTAQSNLAAARFLTSRYRRLLKAYGTRSGFCLVLCVAEPETYGPDFVELIADVTDSALRRPPAPLPDPVAG